MCSRAERGREWGAGPDGGAPEQIGEGDCWTREGREAVWVRGRAPGAKRFGVEAAVGRWGADVDNWRRAELPDDN